MTWGNNVYRYNANWGAFDYLIDDRGGVDTIISDHSWGVRIDLRPGQVSTLASNQFLRLSTSYYNTIENAVGGYGNDVLIGNNVSNFINGRDGNDRIWGLGGNDYLEGWNGADALYGGDGDDYINGATQNDVLRGGAGNDVLLGGQGQDEMNGDSGADTFGFGDIFGRTLGGSLYYGGESDLYAPDFIYGFEGAGSVYGDVIDLSMIDGLTTAWESVNDPLKFNSIYNGIKLYEAGGNTEVYGDVNGDNVTDFRIVIVDGAVHASQYRAWDFAL